jgi:hypothetical protein
MAFPEAQVQELKAYCKAVKALPEGGITYLLLEELQLPVGCEPRTCDALLCSVPRDGYPSRLFLSVQVTSRYTRNWNLMNARIGERNWCAFSWNVPLNAPTLAQLLVAHLNGFTKEK